MTLELFDEFKPLDHKKEGLVLNKLGNLQRDVQVSQARIGELKKNPLGKFRPKVQDELRATAHSALKKTELAKKAGKALIATNNEKIKRSEEREKNIKNKIDTIRPKNNIRGLKREDFQMRQYKEFIKLTEGAHGPKANKYSRGAQRAENSARAALKKAGFRRSGNVDYHSTDSKLSSSSDHKTTISSYANQSDFARDSIKAKVQRKKSGGGSVTPTAERVRQLKHLRRQMGGDRTVRGVHDVGIDHKGDTEHKKNDTTRLISRGKSFKKETRAVPDSLKKIGARPGDIVTASPQGVMPGENVRKGGEKRAGMYQREIGGKADRRTNMIMGRNK